MNLEELKKLAEAATPGADGWIMAEDWYGYCRAANPQTILALITLVELQHGALVSVGGMQDSDINEAIAAYENFGKEAE